jgi:hypothetical protein
MQTQRYDGVVDTTTALDINGATLECSDPDEPVNDHVARKKSAHGCLDHSHDIEHEPEVSTPEKSIEDVENVFPEDGAFSPALDTTAESDFAEDLSDIDNDDADAIADKQGRIFSVGISTERHFTGKADVTKPPFDFRRAEDEWLHNHGYTAERLAKGNEMFPKGCLVRAKIDACIADQSMLRRLVQVIQTAGKKIVKPHQLNGSHPDCLPQHLVGTAEIYHIKYPRTFRKNKTFSMKPSRLVAFFKPVSEGGLAEHEFWKIFAPLDFAINDKASFTTLYHASGRCNVWKGLEHHCLCSDHVNAETGFENVSVRIWHHSGVHGCFHEEGKHCLGDNVHRNVWTPGDRVKYLCDQGCGNFKDSDDKCATCAEELAESTICAVEGCDNTRKGQRRGRWSLYYLDHDQKCRMPDCEVRFSRTINGKGARCAGYEGTQCKPSGQRCGN